MPINPMMYRVFLRDEKDCPDPRQPSDNCFRINSCEKLAWTHTTGNYTPTLEEQLASAGSGSVIAPIPVTDRGRKRYAVGSDGELEVIDKNELPEKMYGHARQTAEGLTKTLSEKSGNPYIFIDLTSRGDRGTAEALSKIIHKKFVHGPSPRAADIGD